MFYCMSRRAASILLSPEERATLETWAHARSLPQRVVQRAQIILRAAAGTLSQEIARRLGVSRPTGQLWRQRFLALRLPGLEKDAPRPGRIPRIPASKIRAVVEATLHTRPPQATYWSTRRLARAQGLSAATIRRSWKQHHLQPHRVKTFKLSRDPQFVAKLHDIVGLYLNPPDKGLVWGVDEKSQIQALDRTQPGLPMKKGRCGTMTHDYKRHGTTTLFAALELAEGRLMGTCLPKHRHQEWIQFLKMIDEKTPPDVDLHLIVDNYSTHKHPRVRNWLKRHPRFHIHFIPTSSSWLNLIERWFREITEKRIRRGVFHNVPELIKAIMTYIDQHNQHPKSFVWTAKAETILQKIQRARRMLDKYISA